MPADLQAANGWVLLIQKLIQKRKNPAGITRRGFALLLIT
jgi:hypothetical protein